jgi:hypothetical protein
MAKPRKAIPEKLRAALQQEIGSTCPICTNTDVGHFDVHHIDENPQNNEPSNLLMLCKGCHSKITKGDISPTEAKGIKRTLVNIAAAHAQPVSTQTNNFHGSINNAIVGSGNTVNIKQPRKTTKQKYPPGCIGHNNVQANYLSYLINRYHEFKAWEVGKENMRWGLFPSQLKKKFKVGTQRTIYNLPDTRFEEVCGEVQKRISGTKLALTKKGSQSSFSSFEKYLEEQGQ